MPDGSSRSDWLRRAREILAEAYGPQTGRITVTVRNESGQEVSWTMPAAGPVGPVPMLSPVEAEIVHAVGAGTLPGKAVAGRLGRRYDSSLRTLLANLVERGILLSTAAGYRVSNTSDTEGRHEATD